MNRITIILLIVVSISGCLVTAGCTESQKQPAEWTERDRVQNDMLIKHNAVIHGLDQEKDGKKVHTNGIIDYLNILNARLNVLEAVDPNEIPLHEHKTPDNYSSHTHEAIMTLN